MVVAIEQLSYKPITATGSITRRLDERSTEPYVSVYDFGAVGDDVTDDTDAIQRAINACFPQHEYISMASLRGNRVLYFPPGSYRTFKPLFMYSVAGAKLVGGGPTGTAIHNCCELDTVTAIASGLSTTGLDGINAQYRTIMTITSVSAGTLCPGTIISGAGIFAGSVISGQLTGTPGGAGTYKVTPTQVVGGPITITGNNTTAFACQGVAYSQWEGLSFASYKGMGFDWFHDNTGFFGPQICLWNHCGFSGPTTGCRVGVGGPQCDTSTWLDCIFGGCDIAIDFMTQNAISNTIIGGDIQSCRIGVHAHGGSVAAIHGMGFQAQVDWDISIEGGFNDPYCITGISTESRNFFHCGSPQAGGTLIGCGQRNASYGVFAQSSSIGLLNIIGCMTNGGKVVAGNPLTIDGSIFYRNDALDDYIASVQHDSIGLINNSYFGGLIANRIIRQKITTAGRRTYDLEATSLTDTVVLYDSYVVTNGTNYIGCSVTIASPGVVSFGGGAHYLLADQPVAFNHLSGSMPTGITADTTYYVSATGLTPTTFTLRTQPGGAGSAVNTSSTGSNVIMRLVRKWAVGDQLAKSNVAAGGSPGWMCTAAGVALTTAGPAAVLKAMANVAA